MDLKKEFQRLTNNQEQILQMLMQNKSAKNELKIYTLDEVAKLFSVTKRTIYNWKDDGRLPLTIIGSKSYLTEAQLQEFLTANTVKAGRRISL